MKKRLFCLLLAMILILSAIPLTASAANFLDYNGHRYEYIDQSMSWYDAEEYCEDRGGHLVTITSKKEQAAVEKLIAGGSKNTYWIGAYRVADDEFAWVTGEKMKYTNWDEGEPNNDMNKGEDCVHLYRISESGKYRDQTGTWNDMPGEGERSFHAQSNCGLICEYDRIGSIWAQTELEKAEEYDLIPEILEDVDYTESITRAEFAAVAVKVYENLSGTKALPAVINPFTDCSDAEVLKAYNIGAVNGTSDTTFSPDALLNREQAAAMLTRVFKRATMPGWTLATDADYPLSYTEPGKFADHGQISTYARESVYFMVANGIINGVGGNKFAPRNTTSAEEARGYANATREQALAIAVRMVENLD